MKKIRIAGPPGTGKTTDLVKTYYSHLDEYDPTDIIVISHTNAAANHIRDRISDDKSVLSFEKDTGKNIFGLIRDSKKTLDENVTTIHKFCTTRIHGDAFNIDDWENLKIVWPEFDFYTNDKKFKSVQSLMKMHPFFDFVTRARDNGRSLMDHYLTLSFEERSKIRYSIEDLEHLQKNWVSFKTSKKINFRSTNILDFQDMIENFTESPNAEAQCGSIKVLIVDEAQDSSVIQRKAEKIISKNVDYFYKAGDPDQAIFEFSGADPDAFHKEFARPEKELKQGYRCPRVINEYCKSIINPIWQHYNYERTWRPREKDGKIVEGEIIHMSDLHSNDNVQRLEEEILLGKENFIFTYRGGEPKEMLRFLLKVGVPFALPKDSKNIKFRYPSKEIKNQRNFLDLANGEQKPFNIIKNMLKSVSYQYLGDNYNTDNLEKVKRGSYSLKWLVDQKFLIKEVLSITDFQEINATHTIEIKQFIRNVINNNRDKEDKRIFLENIHTIKGKEFDNVVLDLTLTREEEDFVRRRMKFVACSRAKEKLWLVKSSERLSL